MASRDHARPVWVDLAAVFGASVGRAEGIDPGRPAAGGLSRWVRTSGGTWVGVVNVVIPMTDGSLMKLEDQLTPARALRPR
jgi:hypothetical protein